MAVARVAGSDIASAGAGGSEASGSATHPVNVDALPHGLRVVTLALVHAAPLVGACSVRQGRQSGATGSGGSGGKLYLSTRRSASRGAATWRSPPPAAAWLRARAVSAQRGRNGRERVRGGEKANRRREAGRGGRCSRSGRELAASDPANGDKQGSGGGIAHQLPHGDGGGDEEGDALNGEEAQALQVPQHGSDVAAGPTRSAEQHQWVPPLRPGPGIGERGRSGEGSRRPAWQRRPPAAPSPETGLTSVPVAYITACFSARSVA